MCIKKLARISPNNKALPPAVLPLPPAGEARSCRRRRSGEGGRYQLTTGNWKLATANYPSASSNAAAASRSTRVPKSANRSSVVWPATYRA